MRILKICQGCVNKISGGDGANVDLVKLQAAMYYTNFELVPADQCQARCHSNGVKQKGKKEDKNGQDDRGKTGH